LSSTAQNKDEAANDIDGVETASLDAQLAQLTAKQPDSDLLVAAQDLDFFKFNQIFRFTIKKVLTAQSEVGLKQSARLL